MVDPLFRFSGKHPKTGVLPLFVQYLKKQAMSRP